MLKNTDLHELLPNLEIVRKYITFHNFFLPNKKLNASFLFQSFYSVYAVKNLRLSFLFVERCTILEGLFNYEDAVSRAELIMPEGIRYQACCERKAEAKQQFKETLSAD